jgi:hypothetical protein
VQVAGGQSTATFAVTTKTVQTTAVQLQATAQGQTATANLGVTPSAAAVTLTGVSAVLSQGVLRLTVALSGPAGPAGAAVNLGGNNNEVVNLSGRQIVVAAGAASASANFAVTPAATDVNISITATLAAVTKSSLVFIPKAVVSLESLSGPSQIGVNRWGILAVYLTERPPASGPVPVISVSGVINQTQWLVPISTGRSTLGLAFRASGWGQASISVSYGGVTKTYAVTVH